MSRKKGEVTQFPDIYREMGNVSLIHKVIKSGGPGPDRANCFLTCKTKDDYWEHGLTVENFQRIQNIIWDSPIRFELRKSKLYDTIMEILLNGLGKGDDSAILDQICIALELPNARIREKLYKAKTLFFRNHYNDMIMEVKKTKTSITYYQYHFSYENKSKFFYCSYRYNEYGKTWSVSKEDFEMIPIKEEK